MRALLLSAFHLASREMFKSRRFSRLVLRHAQYLHALPRQFSTPATTAFITDVEGNGEKFYNAINASSCMKEENERLMFTHPTAQFVFGGDAVDKGPFSVRIMQSLLALKSEESDRVHLIVGNREAKMTRLWEEMGSSSILRTRLCSESAVFWEPKQPPVLYAMQHMKSSGYSGDIHDYVGSLSDEKCQSIYLRWMLTHTMGCGFLKPHSTIDTFELYKQELCDMTRLPMSQITDEDVAQFLMQQVRPGGVFFDYLSKGLLAHRIGDTLFVHGAVTEAGIGYVPGRSHSTADCETSLDEWIDGLNYWFRNEMEKWKRSDPFTSSVPPGDTPLMRYLVHNPKTVTTSNWYNPSTRTITPLSDTVVDYLCKNGVRRVMTGHQPFSDFPLVIRHQRTGVEIVVGDTSYSDPSAEHNTQGVAYNVCELLQGRDGGDSRVVIRAKRKNGLQQVLDLADPTLERLGHVTEDGVYRLNENGKWIVSQVKGFAIEDKPVG